ncbi:MAG: hypothetical protein QN178_01890 [Armatimonadota bacterium]|nr:hypothetical protein [Armatimonadota bacterium]
MSHIGAVEVEVLTEDADAMRRALAAAGRDPRANVPWLLARGLEQYVADEAAWQALEGQEGPEVEVKRQELKRRETEALLVSMRAETIAAERVMHDLGMKVHALGAQLYANRREMWPLRDEAASLEARLKRLTEPATGSASPSATGQGVLAWLRRLLT